MGGSVLDPPSRSEGGVVSTPPLLSAPPALCTKLPDALSDKQKENKITNLLASLRRAGKIMQGEKRQWVLKLL